MRRRPWIGFLVALVVTALGVGGLALWHHHRVKREAAAREKKESRGPKVQIATVELEPSTRTITLPADVRGFDQATIYAKTSGYLARLTVDKGDSVKRNQILAYIESPETDQQVAQARADLTLQERTAARARMLASRDFISRQDLDTYESALHQSRANLGRVKSLQKYQVVRAPFAGVITNRYVDPGALIPAATGSTAGAVPIVDVADLTRVRILVFAGQDVAPFLHVGDPVSITLDEKPGQKIEARISRFTSALDPRSRSMLVEIWRDNSDRFFMPGAYARVTLSVKAPPLPIVPSAAVNMRGGKLMVGVYQDGKLHLQPIVTGLDNGRVVQIKNGLQAGQKVVLNLAPELGEGAPLRTD